MIDLTICGHELKQHLFCSVAAFILNFLYDKFGISNSLNFLCKKNNKLFNLWLLNGKEIGNVFKEINLICCKNDGIFVKKYDSGLVTFPLKLKNIFF